MGFILLIISWFIRTYGAIQEIRSPIETPVIWDSEIAKNTLVLVWIILLLIGIYIIYLNEGLLILLLTLLVYFIVAPALFSNLLKKFLERHGF